MASRTASTLPAVPATREFTHADTDEPVRPASRLFVVQLGEGVGCHGQVEHVLSGRRQAFATAGELLAALGLAARSTAARTRFLHQPISPKEPSR